MTIEEERLLGLCPLVWPTHREFRIEHEPPGPLRLIAYGDDPNIGECSYVLVHIDHPSALAMLRALLWES